MERALNIFIVGMQMFTSLAAGSASTWVLTNSDPAIAQSYYPSLWTFLQCIAALSWSSLLLAPVQLITDYRLIMVIIMVIFYTLWPSAFVVARASVPSDCLQIQHCTQIRVAIKFAWVTLFVTTYNAIIIGMSFRHERTRVYRRAAIARTGANEAGLPFWQTYVRRQSAIARTKANTSGQPASPINRTTDIPRQVENAGTRDNNSGQPYSPIQKPTDVRHPAVVARTRANEAGKPSSSIQETTDVRRSTWYPRGGAYLYEAGKPPSSIQEMTDVRRSTWYPRGGAYLYEAGQPFPAYQELEAFKGFSSSLTRPRASDSVQPSSPIQEAGLRRPQSAYAGTSAYGAAQPFRETYVRHQSANTGTKANDYGQPSSSIKETTDGRGQAADAGTRANDASQPSSPIRKEATGLRQQEVNAGTGANNARQPSSPLQETSLRPQSVYGGIGTDEAGQPILPFQELPSLFLRELYGRVGQPLSLPQENRRRQSRVYEASQRLSPVNYLPSECLQCNKPCAAYRNFCQYSCKTTAERGAPKLIAIHSGHHMYRHISSLLSSSWRGFGSAPSVQAIYAIVLTSNSHEVYFNYKRRIEAKRKCTAAGLTYGNEKLLWHGTGRSCRIGDLGQTTPCTANDCNICRIIKGSFDIARARAGMFGPGIYTTATSSKADSFRRNKNPGTVWNALLLNRVVVGRSLDCHTRTVHTRAPHGYDSVQGIRGRSLGNDETIVYSNDAIRPAYLVMHSTQLDPQIF